MIGWKRWLAVGGLLAFAAGVFVVPTLWGKPWSIDHFFARVFLEFALERPLVLSQLRLLEPYGFDFHADDLDDFSPAFERDEVREVKRNLAILRRYDRASLSESQRISRDVLEWFLELQVQREPFLFHDYPVNQLNGVQKGLVDFMLNIHQIHTSKDAENYRLRLSKIGVAMDQIIEGLRERRERGVVPPRFVVEQVRREIEAFLEPPPQEHLLYTHFEGSLEAIERLAASQREALLAGTALAIEGTVYPACRRLDAALAELEKVASNDAGVWKLPDGDAYYAWLLRRHTTTDLSAEEIHRTGLAEVERIHGEMRAIIEGEGIAVDDLADTLRVLAEVPSFRYPDSDEGRAEILRDYQAIIDEAQARLPEHVGRLARSPVRVERMPEFMEAGAPLSYYVPPPFDGSKPGIFYANLRSVGEVHKFRMRTLAYHDTVPGHHLQTAVAMELEDVPMFRRVLHFTAFSEGWALYAERLAGELGFHPTPWDRLGMLVEEVFRAARLVVDTGIHAKRWTREQAIAYMLETTGKPRSEIVAEVERYIVLPGQACAYKVGQLELLALRERARGTLGADFELREFHDVVLGGGAMPLEILERVVDAWIASKTEAASS